MEKTLVKKYIESFRRFIYPHLRESVSMEVVAYPARDGCLFVFEFNKDDNNGTAIKSKSNTIQEAMQKSDLFDKPQDAPTIQGTKMVLTPNHLVMIKGAISENWNTEAAKRDVSKFVDAVNKK